MFAEYIVSGRRYAGSAIDRIVGYGFSPAEIAFSDSSSFSHALAGATHCGVGDGMVDSLVYLVFHESAI